MNFALPDLFSHEYTYEHTHSYINKVYWKASVGCINLTLQHMNTAQHGVLKLKTWI